MNVRGDVRTPSAKIAKALTALSFCPIKSLMYDQNDNLVKTLVTNVSFITSDLEADERRDIEKNFELISKLHPNLKNLLIINFVVSLKLVLS